MRWRAVQGGWFVVLQSGDDVLECLRQVAREAEIRSASLTGLGAVSGVQLAWYDVPNQRYERLDIEGDVEIGCMAGNLTQVDGQPFAHVHAVISGRDCTAKAGHLMTARCGATVEIFLHDFAAAVHRGPEPSIGLNLCKL
jgi:predicted DNA-binding protein with PD1-like motif